MNRAIGNPIALGIAHSIVAFTSKTGLAPTHVLLGRSQVRDIQRWVRELLVTSADNSADRLRGLVVVRVDAENYYDVALLLPRPGEGSLSPIHDPSLGSPKETS